MPLCKSALNFCQTNGAMCPPPHAFVAESRGLTEERAEPVHWRRNRKETDRQSLHRPSKFFEIDFFGRGVKRFLPRNNAETMIQGAISANDVSLNRPSRTSANFSFPLNIKVAGAG
jgi:hypothetical protein